MLDLKLKMDGYGNGNRDGNENGWTNERHLSYLKSVEASFVRTMVDNGVGRVLPMDRYVPDTCESTLDLKSAVGTKRRKRYFSSDNHLDIRNKRVTRRRLGIQESSSSSQDDQMVPQIKHLKDEDEYDKSWTSLR